MSDACQPLFTIFQHFWFIFVILQFNYFCIFKCTLMIFHYRISIYNVYDDLKNICETAWNHFHKDSSLSYLICVHYLNCDWSLLEYLWVDINYIDLRFLAKKITTGELFWGVSIMDDRMTNIQNRKSKNPSQKQNRIFL